MGNHNVETAIQVIRTIAALFPSFRIPEGVQWDILVDAWASVIADYQFPPQIWQEAVKRCFKASDSYMRPPAPQDVVRGCRSAMRAAESDPARRAALYAWREERNAAKQRKLKEEK